MIAIIIELPPIFPPWHDPDKPSVLTMEDLLWAYGARFTDEEVALLTEKHRKMQDGLLK